MIGTLANTARFPGEFSGLISHRLISQRSQNLAERDRQWQILRHPTFPAVKMPLRRKIPVT